MRRSGRVSTATSASVPRAEARDYPTRVQLRFKGNQGWIVLDHIRTVERRRLVRRLGKAVSGAVSRVKPTLREMLVE